MYNLLSLDISSSTIGWSIFEVDKESTLIEFGHIKPPSKSKSKAGIPYRLDEATIMLKELFDKYDISKVAVEDYARRFSKGKSQAQTIILLAIFNEMSCYLAYKNTNEDPARIPVTKARSLLSQYYGEKIVSKDEIFPIIVSNSKIYKTENNRIGNIKKECYDEVDAIAIGMAYLIEQNPDIKINT